MYPIFSISGQKLLMPFILLLYYLKFNGCLTTAVQMSQYCAYVRQNIELHVKYLAETVAIL